MDVTHGSGLAPLPTESHLSEFTSGGRERCMLGLSEEGGGEEGETQAAGGWTYACEGVGGGS